MVFERRGFPFAPATSKGFQQIGRVACPGLFRLRFSVDGRRRDTGCPGTAKWHRLKVWRGFVLHQIAFCERPTVESRRIGNPIFRAHRPKPWDQGTGHFALLREGDRFAVQRRECRLLGIELPAGVVVDLVGGEAKFDHPAAALLFPAGPALVDRSEIV